MLKSVLGILVVVVAFVAYLAGAFHQKVKVETAITQLCHGFKEPELTQNDNDGFSVHFKCTEPAKWRRGDYLTRSELISVDTLDNHCVGRGEVMTYVGDKLKCQTSSFSAGRLFFW